MTTTDARPGKNLRVHTITVLAAAYLIAWWALAGQIPRTAASTAPVRSTVWYNDLAPGQRPRVVLPPGWSIANATPVTAPAALTAAPREVRVAPAQTRRIRTRSS